MSNFHALLEHINNGNNVLIHGPGGVGKTYDIKRVYETYKNRKNIAVMAPTGKAAVVLDLNAQTINRYFRIPPINNMDNLPDKDRETEINKILMTDRFWLKNVDLFIIDEISMVGQTLMMFIDLILKKERKDDRPMGGAQFLLSGDFYQLPPVKDSWCFEETNGITVWRDMDIQLLEYNEPMRFDSIETFHFLNRLRINKLTVQDKELLDSRIQACKDQLFKDDLIPPMLLYSTNKLVNRYNKMRLDKLPGRSVTFEAKDEIVYKKSGIHMFDDIDPNKIYRETKYELQSDANKILDEIMPPLINVKVDAKIIFCRNYDPDNKLVNGMMGIIKQINPDSILVQIEDGSIHKITKYTYTSKCRDFTCTRIQYPFKLAWAITIHKSQGMTISSAIISLDNICNSGQAYVALSRVKSINGMYIQGNSINYSSIVANKKLPYQLTLLEQNT